MSAKNKRRKNGVVTVLCLLILTSTLCACVFGYLYYQKLQVYRAASDYYTNLHAELAASANADAGIALEGSAVSPGSSQAAAKRVNWSMLASAYENVRAWLYCPDTVIDYPVMQYADNERYMHRLPNGAANASGTLFFDYRNQLDADKNLVIYGHNMRDGSMFASLNEYKSQTYYEAHPEIQMTLDGEQYTLRLFAGFEQDVRYPYDVKLSFADDIEFADYIAAAQKRSDFTCTVDVGAQDRIVTLCTCTTAHSDAYRYFVLALLDKTTA